MHREPCGVAPVAGRDGPADLRTGACSYDDRRELGAARQGWSRWPRSRSTEEPQYEAIIIGAGVCGIYQLYRLVELGVSTTVLEAGADLGGTWFWNRYPGARFDSESVTYGYSFSEELLQEWDWKERFSGQPENLRYLNHVVDKFDLRRYMQFGCTVESAEFDDERHAVAAAPRRRSRADVPLLHPRRRAAVGADPAPLRGPRRLPGPVVPHLQLARGAGRLRRASGWP